MNKPFKYKRPRQEPRAKGHECGCHIILYVCIMWLHIHILMQCMYVCFNMTVCVHIYVYTIVQVVWVGSSHVPCSDGCDWLTLALYMPLITTTKIMHPNLHPCKFGCILLRVWSSMWNVCMCTYIRTIRVCIQQQHGWVRLRLRCCVCV